MGRKYGYSLVEALISLSIGLLIIHSFMILFTQVYKVKIENNQDIVYSLYALSEEVSMANHVEVTNNELVLTVEEKTFYIHLHKNRLVKEPGFNIYLHHIDDVYFFKDEYYVYMTLKRGEFSETFKIGVCFRPNYRICQSDCLDDSTNNNGTHNASTHIDRVIP